MRVSPARRSELERALRLVWFTLGAASVVAFFASHHNAGSSVVEYEVRALVVVLVGLAAYGWRKGHPQDHPPGGVELVPVLVGTIAAIALGTALTGTDFAPGGLGGDQTFRTAAVTRFADSWHNADFTMRGLPSFYPPSYFWVLGRLSHVFGLEPWRMLKIGAIVTAFLVPILAFVLWRRVVSDRVAALFSVVVIVVNNFYEPYAWIVIVAIVPWWLEVMHGLRREGAKPGNPVALGVVGALLVMTYSYFFALAVIAFVLHLVAERAAGTIDRQRIVRSAKVLAVTGIVSAPYWLPLVLSILRSDQPSSLANRWFNAGHTTLPMPMLENTPVGVVALVGFVYLVWAVKRDAVARGLLTFLVAAYCWYLLGALGVATDHPLLSFRGKPMIPMVLLFGGLLGLVRFTEFASSRWDRDDVARVAVALAVALGVYVSQTFVSEIRDSSLIKAANEASISSAASDLENTIESLVGRHATLVSSRLDLLVLYPNHAFVVWDAHYAHPAAEFDQRVAYLRDLSHVNDPQEFADRAAHNPYDAIDAFVLNVDPDTDELVYTVTADDFPKGVKKIEIRFSRAQFADFDLIPVGNDVLAVRI